MYQAVTSSCAQRFNPSFMFATFPHDIHNGISFSIVSLEGDGGVFYACNPNNYADVATILLSVNKTLANHA